ncbi:flagellar brake protein [Pontibacterium granulatum]|uniref:flagellar brake protein n=1 Tax=Pontibacterium granulatum TaxID=2036029 RepID=UPI00249B3E08|nr:flagellar brake protein [Pontibacterium granulatum]MDI3325490.1 flagellar brake protein [Pontibacterium granulatum]
MTEALKKLPENPGLAELKPQVGEKIQLELRSPVGRISSKLLGYKEGVSLMVSASASGRVPLVKEGQRLTARMITGNYIAAFSSRILKIQNTPFTYWHLEYPQQLEVRRIRKHTRVPVNLKVSLDEYEEGSSVVGVWPCSGFCTDISLVGACVEVSSPLGNVGDRIFVTMRVSVAGIDQVVLAPIVIRNVHQIESEPVNVYRHGVEFLELDEDTRLILASFVYQQFLIETGSIDDLG